MATSIKAVETCLPSFIGYTEKCLNGRRSLRYKPHLLSSLAEFEQYFGGPSSATFKLSLHPDDTINGNVVVTQPRFLMHYALRLYFDNGGGPCFIVSAGTYKAVGKKEITRCQHLLRALNALAAVDETTLLCLPDAHLLSVALYFDLLKATLKQAATMKDRFALLDVYHPSIEGQDVNQLIKSFRDGIGSDHLGYGTAYFPWIQTNYLPFVDEKDPSVLALNGGTYSSGSFMLKTDNGINSLYHKSRPLYEAVLQAAESNPVNLPPSIAALATCVMVDKSIGVWKAPASRIVNNVRKPIIPLANNQNEALNVDPVEGKSINSLRFFTGRGTVVWGARTLTGNDNEWRYIPVRRFFMMVEESVKKGLVSFQFEANGPATWTNAKVLVGNFLYQLWRNGALMGIKPEYAFYVKVGVGETMTNQDIQDGRMIIEMGMAPVRPAEFIVLRIVQQMNSV